MSLPNVLTRECWPQAKTTWEHKGTTASNHLRCCCQLPLGVKFLGSVAIWVKQFIKKHPPKPNLLEWEMILFVVGSVLISSAMDGFNPIKSTVGFELSHFLHRTKRSFWSVLKIAPDWEEKNNLRGRFWDNFFAQSPIIKSFYPCI